MAKINVLLNTFEPALTDNNWNTSMAGGAWWLKLFGYLKRYGIEVNNVSVGENDLRTEVFDNAVANINDVDAILLYLRWPMDGERYKMRQAAYQRQLDLVTIARKSSIPVLIFNGDLMETGYDIANEIEWSSRCHMYMPALAPWVNYKTLHFPCPFDDTDFRNVPPVDKTSKFCYIGNDFKIYDQVKRFAGAKCGVIYGPWPEKHDAEKLKQDFPCINFLGRLDQRKIFDVLSLAMYTYHFAKPEYLTCGFIAQRWYEAAVAGTVAFADQQYHRRFENLASFDYDKLPMPAWQYNKLLLEQRSAVLGMSEGMAPWAKAIISLATGD